MQPHAPKDHAPAEPTDVPGAIPEIELTEPSPFSSPLVDACLIVLISLSAFAGGLMFYDAMTRVEHATQIAARV